MSKNQVWLVFLAIMAVIVLGFTGKTGYRWRQYVVQNFHTMPSDLQWSIKEKSSGRYFLRASYWYQVKGKGYEGKTDVFQPLFRNPEAAQKMIADNSKKQWTVWYHPQHPDRSTIVKQYPLKLTIYTVILWGIMMYFVWLGFFVKKRGF
ncbi:MAG: hypothetical protein WB791_05045 [Waddliaceae bacterium]